MLLLLLTPHVSPALLFVNLQETLFQKQARLLAGSIPELFSPTCSVRLVTENGRSLLAKAGCVASSVEYTKWSGGRHIAVTHIGADLCMRACYMPDTWGLRVFVCDAAGRQKEGAAGVEEVVQDIAGPLCFQVGPCVPKRPVAFGQGGLRCELGRIHKVQRRPAHRSNARWCRLVHASLLHAGHVGPARVCM
jgi:hypothetical protein